MLYVVFAFEVLQFESWKSRYKSYVRDTFRFGKIVACFVLKHVGPQVFKPFDVVYASWGCFKFKWCCGCPFFLKTFDGRRKKNLSLRLGISRFLCIDRNQRWRCPGRRGGLVEIWRDVWLLHHCGCWRTPRVCWEFLCDPFVCSIRILQNHQQHLRCWPIMKSTPDFFCQSKKNMNTWIRNL